MAARRVAARRHASSSIGNTSEIGERIRAAPLGSSAPCRCIAQDKRPSAPRRRPGRRLCDDWQFRRHGVVVDVAERHGTSRKRLAANHPLPIVTERFGTIRLPDGIVHWRRRSRTSKARSRMVVLRSSDGYSRMPLGRRRVRRAVRPSRHDNRFACDFLAEQARQDELPQDMDILAKLASALSYDNAKQLITETLR